MVLRLKNQPDMVTHVYSPSTQKAETRGCCEFEARVGYSLRACLKTTEKISSALGLRVELRGKAWDVCAGLWVPAHQQTNGNDSNAHPRGCSYELIQFVEYGVMQWY